MSVSGRSGGDAVLVAALAAGATYVEAAKQAGVSERTVRRRMDDAEFRRQVDQARAEVLAQATARLSAASVEAVETLRGLLGSPLDFARLAAARAILEVGFKYREQLDLAERIEQLEQASELTAAREGGKRR
jgi:transposase